MKFTVIAAIKKVGSTGKGKGVEITIRTSCLGPRELSEIMDRAGDPLEEFKVSFEAIQNKLFEGKESQKGSKSKNKKP